MFCKKYTPEAQFFIKDYLSFDNITAKQLFGHPTFQVDLFTAQLNEINNIHISQLKK